VSSEFSYGTIVERWCSHCRNKCVLIPQYASAGSSVLILTPTNPPSTEIEKGTCTCARGRSSFSIQPYPTPSQTNSTLAACRHAPTRSLLPLLMLAPGPLSAARSTLLSVYVYVGQGHAYCTHNLSLLCHHLVYYY